ncbi:MAG: rhombosortase [Opitutaceae bacterium]|nr:rhombosortase [Opitutaceae bacterium]
MKRLPWLTLTFAALAVAVHCLPALTLGWQFDRAAVAHGQLWRFFTAHLTHFGTDHLRWDLLAFVVLGAMVERISRSAFLVTLALSAALITLGVWVAQPQFTTYRGLSGIDSALFGFVVAHLIAEGRRARHGFSLAVGSLALAGFTAKCVFELVTHTTVFVETTGDFAPVPLAHLLGLLAGAAASGVSALPSEKVGRELRSAPV